MTYYFLGIGGIGMSALARYFNLLGHRVAGYDRTPSELTRQLEQEGIAVHYVDDPRQIPAAVDLVVYTPAVPTDTSEYLFLQQKGIPMKKRSRVLGELTEGRRCVAVAGSHGKTTTSSLIAHLLMQRPQGCCAFLGGIAKNFDSNLVVKRDSEYVVVEADEYDRSFLQLHPFYSVVTATDPDHLDIYGTHEQMLKAFEQYANQTNPEGHLFVKSGVGFSKADLAAGEGERKPYGLHVEAPLAVSTYSMELSASDFYASRIRAERGSLWFDLHTPQGVVRDLQLVHSCLYNVENAVAASAVALACGLTEAELRQGLATFSGIRRRFDFHIEDSRLVYIDDYAHHPQEIAATIASVRYLYPGRKVVGVFQPHLYSRTADLYREFAAALSALDEVVLLDIYPARELPLPGVTSELIAQEIRGVPCRVCSREAMPQTVVSLHPEVVLTLGAGDIDRLVPQLAKTLNETLSLS